MSFGSSLLMTRSIASRARANDGDAADGGAMQGSLDVFSNSCSMIQEESNIRALTSFYPLVPDDL